MAEQVIKNSGLVWTGVDDQGSSGMLETMHRPGMTTWQLQRLPQTVPHTAHFLLSEIDGQHAYDRHTMHGVAVNRGMVDGWAFFTMAGRREVMGTGLDLYECAGKYVAKTEQEREAARKRKQEAELQQARWERAKQLEAEAAVSQLASWWVSTLLDDDGTVCIGVWAYNKDRHGSDPSQSLHERSGMVLAMTRSDAAAVGASWLPDMQLEQDAVAAKRRAEAALQEPLPGFLQGAEMINDTTYKVDLTCPQCDAQLHAVTRERDGKTVLVPECPNGCFG